MEDLRAALSKKKAEVRKAKRRMMRRKSLRRPMTVESQAACSLALGPRARSRRMTTRRMMMKMRMKMRDADGKVNTRRRGRKRYRNRRRRRSYCSNGSSRSGERSGSDDPDSFFGLAERGGNGLSNKLVHLAKHRPGTLLRSTLGLMHQQLKPGDAPLGRDSTPPIVRKFLQQVTLAQNHHKGRDLPELDTLHAVPSVRPNSVRQFRAWSGAAAPALQKSGGPGDADAARPSGGEFRDSGSRQEQQPFAHREGDGDRRKQAMDAVPRQDAKQGFRVGTRPGAGELSDGTPRPRHSGEEEREGTPRSPQLSRPLADTDERNDSKLWHRAAPGLQQGPASSGDARHPCSTISAATSTDLGSL